MTCQDCHPCLSSARRAKAVIKLALALSKADDPRQQKESKEAVG